MKILNEHYQPLNEDMRFEALSQLRELQSNLVGISFLPVIAIMKETNPLKKAVLKFQDDLDELTISIQEFISDAKNDIDYEEAEGDEPEEDEELEDEELEDEKEDLEDDKEELKDDKKELKDKKEKAKKKKKVEDSSEPGE